MFRPASTCAVPDVFPVGIRWRRGAAPETTDESIFKVPENLRRVDWEAFEPHVVSIGPYNYGRYHFQEMTNCKREFCSQFLTRTDLSEETCRDAMTRLEGQARWSYSPPVSTDNMETEYFVEMMLVDACFIIELFLLAKEGYSHTQPISNIRHLVTTIQKDLLLLENQLPFFVLEEIFGLASDEADTTQLVQLALEFFDSVIPVNNSESDTNYKPLHLLHLIQQALISPRTLSRSSETTYQPSQTVIPVHRARLTVFPVTVLREYGVEFKKETPDNCFETLMSCCSSKVKKKSDKLLDIEFDKGKGVLKIPPLMIHDFTKPIFLNLMAFEQHYPFHGQHVTSYLFFMDNLINSNQDVSHLRRQEIIDNWLGSEDDVAKLFNGLCKGITINYTTFYLKEVASNVNQYAQKKRHGWMATLKHQYLRNPWAIAGLLVGLMILLLTTTQTVYAVLAYHVPSSH